MTKEWLFSSWSVSLCWLDLCGRARSEFNLTFMNIRMNCNSVQPRASRYIIS